MSGFILYSLLLNFYFTHVCDNVSLETCTELPALDHGTITYDSDHSSPQKLSRTVATYSCDEGYSLSIHENEKRVCQQSGQWSGVAPTCIGKTNTLSGLSS